jgi:hypothetical protein
MEQTMGIHYHETSGGTMVVYRLGLEETRIRAEYREREDG